MKRRLYFLLPGREQALQVIEQLNKSGIKSENIHALSDRRTELSGLPTSTLKQVKDTASRLENILWNANLISFMLALCTLVAMILTLNWGWWFLIPVITLVANFLAGLTICTVSNTQLGEFQNALDQGEILLMVDVAASRAAKVMAAVDYQTPEPAVVDTGWGSTTALGT
jgi:hypothetical protein